MIENYRVVPVRRTHIGLIIFVVVCLVVALAFYMHWFSLSEHRDVTNKVDVNLKIDRDKIKRDVRQATETTERKASEFSADVKDKAKELKARATNKD